MKKEELLVISPYPSINALYDNKYSALASFAKNTVDSLLKNNPNLTITVFADIYPGSESYQTERLNVKRVWKRNILSSYISLLQKIVTSSPSKILFEVEWGLFGKNVYLTTLIPFFIFLLRLIGKDVYTVIHGVSLNFSLLSEQLGIERKSIKATVYNLGLKLFYGLILLTSTKVIVLEQYFNNLLNSFYHSNKAVFIPHGVDTTIKAVDKKTARRKLGIKEDQFVLLNFGFLNWYKGSDSLVSSFDAYTKKTNDKQSMLILAGGISLVHNISRSYKQFIQTINATVKTNKLITLTGFVPQKDIPLYFAASDIVVFPYRVFISSSGPLSFAFSFKKPILISPSLKEYFTSTDIGNCAGGYRVSPYIKLWSSCIIPTLFGGL